MKCFLISCDVGILFTNGEEEFDFYSCVYDHKYSYCDENIISYEKENLDEAIEYAKQYVNDGVDMTYAVITNQGQHHRDKPFDDGDIADFTYNSEDVVYSIAKINGKIVENFIQK